MAREGSFSSSKRAGRNVLVGEEEIIHDINVGNIILSAFKSDPDFIGQVDAETGEQTTFRQMRENSIKCALWLQKQKFKNLKIAICTRNQMIAYIPFLAGIYIGAIINPWDINYCIDIVRVMYFLVEYEPSVIFIDNDNYEQLQQAIHHLNKNKKEITTKIISIDKTEISLESILSGDFDEADIDQFTCEESSPMDIVGLMFSFEATRHHASGMCMRRFVFTYPSNQQVPDMSLGGIGLWYGSLCWTYGMLLTVRSIVSNVTVIKSSKFSEENLYKTIEKYKVTWVFLQSNMCNQLLQTVNITKYNLSSLKELAFGDTVIKRNIQEELIKSLSNVSVVQVFSIADVGVIATYQRSNNRIGSSGYVAKNVLLNFFGIKTKRELGPNKVGAIWCRLSTKWCNIDTCKLPICSIYQAKQVKPKFLAPIISIWRCTNDYGYYEQDGEIYIIDKISNIIKYKDYIVSPVKIEDLLQCHPAVSEVVVRSVPSSTDGQHPIAYVKKKSDAKVTEEELIQFVAKNFPDNCKLRGGVRFTKEMPYLPNGKIDRELVLSFVIRSAK